MEIIALTIGTLVVSILGVYFLGIINAHAIIGLFNATDTNMIFEKPAKAIKKSLVKRFGIEWGSFIFKPIVGCYKCMSSLWAGLPMLGLLISVAIHLSLWWLYWLSLPLAIVYTCYVSSKTNALYDSNDLDVAKYKYYTQKLLQNKWEFQEKVKKEFRSTDDANPESEG